MRIFYRRPLALAGVLSALTAIGAQWLPARGKLWAVGILLFLLLLAFLVCKRRRLLCALCLTLSVLTLLSSFLFFDLRYAEAQRREGETVTLSGVVLERIYSKPYASRFRIRAETVDGEEVSYLAVLDTAFAASVQVGDRIEARVTPRAYQREGDYEEETYYLSQGCLTVFVCAEPSDCSTLEFAEDSWRIRFSKWNTALSYRLVTSMERDLGGLCAALLLGNRSFLPEEIQLQFRRVGISHLLALSGLHVSILIAFLDRLLRLLRLPKLGRAIGIPVAALGYLCLTGFAPSTLRAVLMVCVLYLAFLSRARYDSFTALCVVLAGILLFTPYAVLDLSLWMSFLAAGAIVIFSPAVSQWLESVNHRLHLPERLFSAVRSLVTALFVGVIANVALLLLLAAVYGEISLLSVPATLLLSIPVTLLLPFTLLALAVPALAFPAAGCAAVLVATAKTLSSLSGILLPVNDVFTMTCFGLLTAVLILWAVCRVRHRYPMLFISLLLIVSLGCSLTVTHRSSGEVAVRCASDGSGEVLLFSMQGHAVAVDLSDGTAGDANLLYQAAKEGRCTELDDLILTRYYSRLPYLVISLCQELRVETLRLPTPLNDREAGIAYRLEQEAARYGVTVRYDHENLGIPSLTVLCATHTPLVEEGSRVLFSVRANREVMTCLNGASLEGGLAEVAKAYLQSSDILLVSMRAKGSRDIVVPPQLKRLILSDPSMASRFWRLPAGVVPEDLSTALCFFLK